MRLVNCALSLVALLVVTLPTFSDEPKKKAGPDHSELIGKPAPQITGDFELTPGQSFKLSELKGKVVVVDFWAVWCGPCVGLIPHVNELQKQYKDKGLVCVGVTTYYERHTGFDKEKGRPIPVAKDEEKPTKEKEQEMLRGFAAHHKMDYRVVAVSKESWQTSCKDYGVTGIPEVVVIDRKGNVRLVVVGGGEKNCKSIDDMVKELVEEKEEK